MRWGAKLRLSCISYADLDHHWLWLLCVSTGQSDFLVLSYYLARAPNDFPNIPHDLGECPGTKQWVPIYAKYCTLYCQGSLFSRCHFGGLYLMLLDQSISVLRITRNCPILLDSEIES